MSIPDRLWRVVKGYWELADDRLDTDARWAEASAYQELADVLRVPEPPREARESPGTPAAAALPRPEGRHDPMEAAYVLLKLDPGADLQALELARQARLSELPVEQHAPGTAERAALDGKRAAVEAAYERLRDALNPTETRFEHLEF